ncbi:MAG: fatty acid desaturase [Ilumatobacteraceae bacterium]|nr:fatty acid desaturase [Ilumatobacteraceae bacterium]
MMLLEDATPSGANRAASDVSRAITSADLARCRPDRVLTRRAVRRLRAKTVVIGAMVLASYVGLLLFANGPLLAIPLAMMLVVALVATGTGVMHDANHGAFGRPKWLNTTLAFTADVLGASSWFWRHQHNGLHHGNTNVVGVDSDIDQMPFARLAPGQPWKPRHRYQHIYMWPLYGFLTLRMLLLDSTALFTHRTGGQALARRPKRRDILELFAGKALHLVWAIGVPILFHRWWMVLGFYLGCSWTVGLILATFFQLAHCNDLVGFADADTERRGNDFSLHQLDTTANVHTAGVSRPVGWLMGGLNHQIEHHLAPGVPHPAYPAMADSVRQVCSNRHIAYHEHPSFRAAVASHVRWLRVMGRRPTVATPPTERPTIGSS